MPSIQPDFVYSSRLTIAALLILGLSLVACQKEPEQDAAPPKGERVENSALGMAIAELPAFFKLSSNEGPVIELVPADPQVEGVLKVQEGPAQTSGVNLVAAVERHKADLQGRSDGVFKGQQELGSQLGTAFYSRGLYSEGGRTMEETLVFIVHPKGDRELQMMYSYPSGEDSKERLMDQLFVVLGELEPIEAAAETEG